MGSKSITIFNPHSFEFLFFCWWSISTGSFVTDWNWTTRNGSWMSFCIGELMRSIDFFLFWKRHRPLSTYLTKSLNSSNLNATSFVLRTLNDAGILARCNANNMGISLFLLTDFRGDARACEGRVSVGLRENTKHTQVTRWDIWDVLPSKVPNQNPSSDPHLLTRKEWGREEKKPQRGGWNVTAYI